MVKMNGIMGSVAEQGETTEIIVIRQKGSYQLVDLQG